MAEEVGFEPTFAPNENVNDWHFLDFWGPFSREKKAKKVGFDSNLLPSENVNGFGQLEKWRRLPLASQLH